MLPSQSLESTHPVMATEPKVHCVSGESGDGQPLCLLTPAFIHGLEPSLCRRRGSHKDNLWREVDLVLFCFFSGAAGLFDPSFDRAVFFFF